MPPVLELKPHRDRVKDSGDSDQYPVRSQILTEQRPAEPVEHRAESGHYREHDEVRSRRAQPSPLAGPWVNQKPQQQPRRQYDDAQDTENISNAIHDRITIYNGQLRESAEDRRVPDVSYLAGSQVKL